MQIQTIHVEGFGPHYDTTLTLPDGLFAVTGDTGAGKSTLIGASVACLYGYFPDGPRVQQCLTANGSGKGKIAVTFSHRGKTYEATRTLGSSTKATLLCDGDVIAGPKVGDFEAVVTELLGSRELADAIWYAARRPRIDLITNAPAQRRQIFGELVGFEALSEISNRFKAEYKAEETRAASIRAGLPNIAELDEQLRTATTQKGEADAAARHTRDTITRLEEELEGERNKAALIGTPADYTHKKQAAEQAQRLYNNRLAELSDVNRSIETAEKDAAALEDAQKAVAEAADLEKQRGDLEHQRDAHNAHQRWQEKRTSLSDRLHKLMQTGAPAIKPADHIYEIAGLYENVAGEVSVLTKLAEKASNDKAKAESHAEAKEREVESLRKQASQKPETPGDDATCSRCPLLIQWQGIGDRLQQAEEELALANDRFERLTEEQEAASIRLRDKRERFEDAVKCQKEIDQYEAEAKGAEEVVKLRDSIRQEIAELDANQPTYAKDPRPKLAKLDASLSSARDRARWFETAKAGAERLPELRDKAASIRSDVDRLREEAAKAHEAAEEARTAYQSIAEARATHDQQIDNLTRSLSIQRANLENVVAEASRLQTTIEATEKAIAEASEKSAEAQRIDKRAEGLAWLATCYSPKGVQPVILDKFLPRLDDLMNDILDEMTDRQLSCSWRTQRATGSGDVVEGLDLTVMDQNGERDAGLCSGGEQQTLQIALRIALNTWITELRGSAHFETLVIDEAGNNTDDEATKRLFEQVAKVSDRFGNVCLITPKAEAARLVPNRVYIERRGVVVNVR